MFDCSDSHPLVSEQLLNTSNKIEHNGDSEDEVVSLKNVKIDTRHNDTSHNDNHNDHSFRNFKNNKPIFNKSQKILNASISPNNSTTSVTPTPRDGGGGGAGAGVQDRGGGGHISSNTPIPVKRRLDQVDVSVTIEELKNQQKIKDRPRR